MPHMIHFKNGSSLVHDENINFDIIMSIMNVNKERLLFASDWHFGHAHIAYLRGFLPENFNEIPDEEKKSGIEAMNRSIVDAVNETIPDDGVIVFLGDTTSGSMVPLNWVNEINCRKVLISGNHDHVWSRRKSKKIDRYLEVFDVIVTKGSIFWESEGIVLSHIPPVPDFHGQPGRSEWDMIVPQQGGYPVICGHVHGDWDVYGKCVNVGVDVRDRPMSLAEVKDIINSLPADGVGALGDINMYDMKVKDESITGH